MDFLKREEKENDELWKKILGEELWNAIKSNSLEKMIFIQDDKQGETQDFQRFFEKVNEGEDIYEEIDKEIFGPIYSIFINIFLRWKISVYEESLLRFSRKKLVQILYESIYNIPFRVCIYEMHRLKNQKALQGENSRAEYDFYCNRYLKDYNYVKKLCHEYPEMFRLVSVRLLYTYQYLMEFLNHLEKDKNLLEKKFCGGKQIQKIEELRIGSSDRHNGGKTIIKVCFDNGVKLIYKPHSLNNEIAYRNFYNQICGEIEIPIMHYEIVDKETYGWETYLEMTECQKTDQISMYFRRLGIHLFLGYLLNGTDIHQENILAVGEFPVLLDAETLPGIIKKHNIHGAEERIYTNISDSVLKTGILPVPVWKNDNKGVILNAIHGERGAITSMKIPVIINEKTSEMMIESRQVEIGHGKSMPVMYGKKVDASQFLLELQGGFREAYCLWMKKKDELEPQLNLFWKCETRFLIRHTQQYDMYLSSSLHPFFLRDSKRRLMMLQIMQKEEKDKELVQQEIQAMYQMDFPLFLSHAKDENRCYQISAYDSFGNIVLNMGKDDLERQLELINISMDMLKVENRMSYYLQNTHTNCDGWLKNDPVEEIIKRIEKKAVVEANDIGWMKVHYEGDTIWQMMAVDLSLYDGIGGIAVFFAQAQKNGYVIDNEMFEKMVYKIFTYIDGAGKQDRHTGLLIGEGAIAYTCLILYRITGEDRFEKYAKKQAESLRNLYLFDESYDLLAGNAGAIILLTEMYKQFSEDRWLQLAVEIGDFLWTKAEKQPRGYGWRCQNEEVALAGMAHGNSGFITAYAELLRYTHDSKYRCIIDELLNYENSLYSMQSGNWRDMRYPQQEVYGNAWCHGAAGILLARLKLLELDESAYNGKIAEDINNAAKVLFEQSERNGMCICHGMAGNYRIMLEYAKVREITEQQKKIIVHMKKLIMEAIVGQKKLLPHDKYAMGMMTGIAGIGSILLL